ncbi:MAG: MBL fold metallo-hydrolase [Gammaproteobacteria bacterium]|nr:MBL fold metallo-hydrolase [Gammaproteobacteria bacterium]MBP6052354.1 MBL fold metallo-hydrolase [Pseudomonadales bacterium]MBK6584804.1 MBL fold metallo-hydrolase [Gammaproteobacteria bacterium]MBK7169979.1 MBL fold metallo-hydrolase [Gammaproteobacteria bacterium]MBK7519685.1 MBL fold metallo-hydrolase [Gammaproteobacteria bacterium]
MKIYVTPVTPFEQNCSVIVCGETLQAAVVDPGGNLERIRAVLAKAGARLVKILLTHAHIDHAGGTAELAREFKVPIEGPHRDDQFLIEGLAEQGRMFGLGACESFTPDRWLEQGDTVSVGECVLQVLHCPGHTPGHVVFYSPEQQLAIVGDVLFAGSIGRTDLPRGDHQQLLDSIRDRLWPLGDEVTFIPGHGPRSTFGRERRNNPFVRDSAFI